MKVSKVTPVPVSDVVRIELSSEEATILRYFLGRVSHLTLNGCVPHRVDEIYIVTSSLYFALYEAEHGD